MAIFEIRYKFKTSKNKTIFKDCVTGDSPREFTVNLYESFQKFYREVTPILNFDSSEVDSFKLSEYGHLSIEDFLKDTSGELIFGGSSGSRIEYFGSIFAMLCLDAELLFFEADKVCHFSHDAPYRHDTLRNRDVSLYDLSKDHLQVLDHGFTPQLAIIESYIAMDDFKARSLAYSKNKTMENEARARYARRAQAREEKNKKLAKDNLAKTLNENERLAKSQSSFFQKFVNFARGK